MKLEEYLRENKELIQHDSPSEEMWEEIGKATLDRKPGSRQFPFWRIAAMLIFVLIVSFWVNHFSKSSNEKSSNSQEQLKVRIAQLAQGNKTSERIMAVNMVDEAIVEDGEIIQVLVDRMQLDESKNVQLAAVSALTKYLNYENVRIAMLDQLVSTKDPYIQMKLIAALTKYKEAEGDQGWNALLESKTRENSLFDNETKEM